MYLIQPRRTYTRINSSSDYGPDADNSITLKTFASGPSIEPASSGKSPLEFSPTHYIRHDPHQDDSPITNRQSTTTAFSGWRLGAWTAGGLALVSLIINLAAAIYLATHRDAETTLVEIYQGDCDKVQSLDLWIHLLINLISTLLLGGSNYCMQCLCSPSRDELDRAHTKGIPLDIGVPSPRNLFAVSGVKRVLWWILACSSIPLHLMYNSAFYTSIGAQDYGLYVVQPDFLSGHVTYDPTDRNFMDPSLINPNLVYQNYNSSHQFKNLTNLECIQAYAKTILTNSSTLLLVTSNSSSNYTVVAARTFSHGDHISPAFIYEPYYWICTGDPNLKFKIDLYAADAPCDEYVSQIEAVADEWTVLGQSIDYCLAETSAEECTFSGNLPIVIVVLICNLIKALIMIYSAAKIPGNPLITIGDAIQSFLNNPDPTTKGTCWATRRDILDFGTYAYHFPHAPWPANVPNAKVAPQTVSLRERRWFNAPGYTRWLTTVAFMSLALSVAISLFIWGYSAVYHGETPTRLSMKQLGFGALQPISVISFTEWDDYDSAKRIMGSVLVANLPQVILSFLYLNLNGLLTSMWLADEWHRFATQRKYLRVSSPKGNQRSTHFLQLPYKISIPLMVVSGILHWLLSRSIFLAVVSERNQLGGLVDAAYIASCGYSLLPILCTIALGFFLMFLPLGFGFRRYDGRIPLVGSCSAAISAACHRPEWDRDAALKPVQYGHVNGGGADGVGHCCFTSDQVECAVEGKLYA